MSDKAAVCGVVECLRVVCHGLIGKPKPHQVIRRHGLNGSLRIGSREFDWTRFREFLEKRYSVSEFTGQSVRIFSSTPLSGSKPLLAVFGH